MGRSSRKSSASSEVRRASTERSTEDKYVLAFDVSSSCTGFCFGSSGVPFKYGKRVADKKGGEGEKLLSFSKWVAKTINTLPNRPHRVVIESPFLRHNRQTFALLSKYVAVVQREVFRILKLECEFIDQAYRI